MRPTASGAEAPVDVDVLRHEIEKTYTEVSTAPEHDFIFPTRRAWAQDDEVAERRRGRGRRLSPAVASAGTGARPAAWR